MKMKNIASSIMVFYLMNAIFSSYGFAARSTEHASNMHTVAGPANERRINENGHTINKNSVRANSAHIAGTGVTVNIHNNAVRIGSNVLQSAVIIGGAGNNVFYAGGGPTILSGGGGSSKLVAGPGATTLMSGTGARTFSGVSLVINPLEYKPVYVLQPP